MHLWRVAAGLCHLLGHIRLGKGLERDDNLGFGFAQDRRDLFRLILAQLWKSFPSFRNEAKFTTWMYRVALNTAITSFKKDKRKPDQSNLEIESFQLAVEEYDHETEEQIKLLYKAIANLSGIEKSIVLLYLENKKYEEIAEITGITQNYVRVKMNRIKKKLKKYMDS